MFTQYFGNYLLESGIISVEQFKEALRQIKDTRVKLGVLAIEAGYMTPSQVEEVISMQMQVDKKFGEIALIKGYMTDFQLESLLARQTNPFSVFSQIMIDNGYMSYLKLSELLESYKKQCGLSAEGFQKFQAGDISPVMEKTIPDPVGDPLKDTVVRSYIELFIRNILRFVSDHVTIGEAGTAPPAQGDWIACQQLDGTRCLTAFFFGSEDAMRYIACKFAKADYIDFNLACDILGEFINCINGIFTANAHEFGMDLNPSPQYVTNDFNTVQTEDMFCIGFSIENHSYHLSLVF